MVTAILPLKGNITTSLSKHYITAYIGTNLSVKGTIPQGNPRVFKVFLHESHNVRPNII